MITRNIENTTQMLNDSNDSHNTFVHGEKYIAIESSNNEIETIEADIYKDIPSFVACEKALVINTIPIS